MSSCPPAPDAYSDTDLLQRYSGGVMESSPPGKANRSADGLLTPDYLAQRIASLKGGSEPTIPAPPVIGENLKVSESEAINAYVAATEVLKAKIKNEYCHYLNRYKYAITRMVNTIGSATTSGVGVGTGNSGPSVAVAVRNYTDAAREINTAMLDLAQISNAITEDQYAQARNFNTRINDLNDQINNYFKILQGHAAILKKEVPAVEIRKRMVEYTKEKANANRNLLSFYFFLDIVALGILFYVYKAT